MFDLLTFYVLLLNQILTHQHSAGNLILDTGSKSSEHVMPMMLPIMSHHFNPYSYYPMHQEHHQPPMIVHPIYIEDHSAMHQHHQPEQHHQYHHEEPHYQHNEIEYQHHEPMHEVHHEEHHGEHHGGEHHEMPVSHHYEHEGHHEEEGHHGYENHPMLSMMMHGSGIQPAYQHLAAMHLYHSHDPMLYAHQMQNQPGHSAQQPQQQDNNAQSSQKNQQTVQPGKQSSLIDKSLANNPFAAIIRPLFKRTNNTNNSQASEKKP